MTLHEKYQKEIIPRMKEIFGYRNNLAVPKVEKVVLNCGIGRLAVSASEAAVLENIQKDLAAICGQSPGVVKAKKSISAFKLREGMKAGFKVTLRGKRMYDFLSRFINIALPRSRDFRGIDEKSFDKKGNLTIGIKEHIVFPEVLAEGVKSIFGFEVIICVNSRSRQEAVELLKLMGFPIKGYKVSA
jgi:large subunit ribosomal protein L5